MHFLLSWCVDQINDILARLTGIESSTTGGGSSGGSSVNYNLISTDPPVDPPDTSQVWVNFNRTTGSFQCWDPVAQEWL